VSGAAQLASVRVSHDQTADLNALNEHSLVRMQSQGHVVVADEFEYSGKKRG
jgi:hypothetical protein